MPYPPRDDDVGGEFFRRPTARELQQRSAADCPVQKWPAQSRSIYNMKAFFALLSGLLLSSCADMYVTKVDVATPGGGSAGPIDAKDFSSLGIHMTNCGVAASHPSAIYIRPFCIDTAVFEGDQANNEGEMPMRKAIAPVEFAEDLKQELERIAPARILEDHEHPRVGWLVEGRFERIDGGSPDARFFFGYFGSGRSFLALHVKITDVTRHEVIYEFDMAGGSGEQGRFGTLRSAGLGKAIHFDLRNAAQRMYIALSTNPYRFGEASDAVLQ